jgi:hypothetical protein
MRRMSEAAQAELDVLRAISESGVRPGIPIEAVIEHGELILAGAGGECVLPLSLADQIFIAAT